ncbi:unnamed protein product [[Candida] boidinii]|uniref:Unnamed protein product n=1 Tax=Candida boidinii TaxID=5477 RepID=A0A9W6WHT6_CANBO|nr:hypothetical protein B5S30_g1606 [[Candida] boidinii]OWB84328.1 hypothetical protein B5S33_g2971 [[Candida] boidinii]GME70298.1 unnamed protein product [[Candida] boidinii]GMG17796.1 unnamed protein product [[Candida] boidinii]
MKIVRNSANCHVVGGTFQNDNQSTQFPDHIINKCLNNHNFKNEMRILLPKANVSQDSINNLKDLFNDAANENITKNYVFNINLFNLIKSILKFKPESRSSISLISNCSGIDHQDSISITHGHLILKLSSEWYYKSGLIGNPTTTSKVSSMRAPNKIFRMIFDLNNFEKIINGTFKDKDASLTKTTKANSHNKKNYMRLLWFIENVYNVKEFEMVLTQQTLDSTEDVLISRLSKEMINFKYETIAFELVIKNLGLLNIPNLFETDKKDEYWLQEVLEWLTYTSMNGPQVSKFDNTDSFISEYKESVDFVEDYEEEVMEIVVLPSSTNSSILNKSIINNQLFDLVFENFVKANILSNINFSWLSILNFGVKSVNTSHGVNDDHEFIDNGENDIVILFDKNSEYIIWSINSGNNVI